VALLDPPARLGAVLERDDLVTAIPTKYLGADRRAVHQRTTDAGIGTVGDEQDSIERDRLAGFDVEELDLELGADLDSILLSAGLDDCVHGSSGLAGSTAGDAHRRSGCRTGDDARLGRGAERSV